MITNIDELTGDAFREVCSDFRVMLLQFAEKHDMTQEAIKSYVASIGGEYEYEIQKGNTTL
jgi:hypothetical protein